MIKFSLIVPIYKVERYLSKCIESIINQTYTNFEVILVNDGSPDACGKICDDYALRDNRIKVIHKENGGVSSARNIGIENASGEYIWFIDSDDWIERYSLQVLADQLEGSKSNLVIFDSNIIENKNIKINRFNESCNSIHRITMEKFFEEYYFKYKVGFEIWNKIYSRKVIFDNNIRFAEDEKIGEDLFFNIQYYTKIKSLNYNKSVLYNYVIREGSAMSNLCKSRHKNLMSVYFKIQKYFIENNYSKEILQYIFIMHLISGINYSKKAKLTAEEYYPYLKEYFKKVCFVKNINNDCIRKFLINERSSGLGRIRINIFFLLCNNQNYYIASKIMLGR